MAVDLEMGVKVFRGVVENVGHGSVGGVWVGMGAVRNDYENYGLFNFSGVR